MPFGDKVLGSVKLGIKIYPCKYIIDVLMKKENTFWTLLQAGLWQKVLPALDAPLSKEEWQGIFDLAVKQSLDGIIYDGMMMLPEEQRPDRILQLKWYGRVKGISMLPFIVGDRDSVKLIKPLGLFFRHCIGKNNIRAFCPSSNY